MDKKIMENLLIRNDLDIKSELINLNYICSNNFNYSIPLYQRLYVWKEDQIETLLNDLQRAISNQEDNYFLGGIMVTKNSDNERYDLIDGQQRFTTLWLISHELQEELDRFTYSDFNKQKQPRINFSVREFANKYFDNPDKFESFSDEEKEQLQNIVNGRRCIAEFFKTHSNEEKLTYSHFVLENLKFIKTEMPLSIDENRLFEVLNNRGAQLQHHQILKNRLLSKIEAVEKEKYAKILDACSIMDNYIEKNIKEVGNFKWSELTFNPETEEKEVDLPKDIFARFKFNNQENKALHLSEILQRNIIEEGSPVKEEFEYDSGKVRSIISFPMLLLHTLRIYIYQKEGQNSVNDVEINEKKLLELFENAFQSKYYNEECCKEFIELLWHVRLKFDKYIIKWVEVDNNEEHHLIKKLYLNKDSLQRKSVDNIRGMELLQSMLYHSQQIITHYWLTPFLFKMLNCDNFDDIYSFLKKLDTSMFCGDLILDLKNRSWRHINYEFEDFQKNIDELNKPKGTTFKSYWFYKLEFILWHELLGEYPHWKDYRMTKKNSVEHISPQTPKDYDENKLWNENENLNEGEKKNRLDDFGNLVLLSVGMNSEYSNKTFFEKQTSFKEKKRLDSLKSDIIFKNKTWDNNLSINHREEMINLFVRYIDLTMN